MRKIDSEKLAQLSIVNEDLDKRYEKQVAEEFGHEQSYIARVENGKADIQHSSFFRIAAITGIQFVPTFMHSAIR